MMPQQLKPEQIKWMGGLCQMKRPDPPITLTHKGVPDGAYDVSKTNTRIFVYNQFAHMIASKMWVESEDNSGLPEWMRVEWGSYPDLP